MPPSPTKRGPPKLPIENRSTTGPPGASPVSRHTRTSPGGPSKYRPRADPGGKVRWADYTPTHQLHDYTPSPWPQDGRGFDFGAFSGAFPTPGYPSEGGHEPSTVWPATPTPSGGGGAYGFDFMGGDRLDFLPPPPSGFDHMTLSMQAPPRVAAMAAAAAHAAAAAAAAAAGAVDGRRLGKSSQRFEALNGLRQKVKNTFIEVDEGEDNEDLGLPSKARTMPNVLTKQLSGLSSTECRDLEDELNELVDEPPQSGGGQEQGRLSPSNSAASLPSKGSANHGLDTGIACRPCAWFWKEQGCQNDKDCGYCHLCPEGELKCRKKSKVAAMRMGALAPAKHQGRGYGASNAYGGGFQHGNGNGNGTARVLKLSPLI